MAHLIITMIKWIRTSRLSIKNSLSAQLASADPAGTSADGDSLSLSSVDANGSKGAASSSLLSSASTAVPSSHDQQERSFDSTANHTANTSALVKLTAKPPDATTDNPQAPPNRTANTEALNGPTATPLNATTETEDQV